MVCSGCVLYFFFPFRLLCWSRKVDIVVATHAVLSTASTAFKDLGLAVVDEEQRFGVEQREKLTSESAPCTQ